MLHYKQEYIRPMRWVSSTIAHTGPPAPSTRAAYCGGAASFRDPTSLRRRSLIHLGKHGVEPAQAPETYPHSD